MMIKVVCIFKDIILYVGIHFSCLKSVVTGIRVPKINSQGKVKTFKCKQCDFVTVTKEDFWRHTKMHIKPEKMLNW